MIPGFEIKEIEDRLGICLEDLAQDTSSDAAVIRSCVWHKLHTVGYSYSSIGSLFNKSDRVISYSVRKLKNLVSVNDSLTLRICHRLEV